MIEIIRSQEKDRLAGCGSLNSLAQRRHSIRDNPAFADAAYRSNEVFQNSSAVLRMRHFGMELQAEGIARPVFNRRVIRILRGGDGDKSFGQTGEFVSVRIPDLKRVGQILEQRARGVADGQGAFAEFPFLSRLDFAGQKVRQDLNAVTDAENRNAELEDAFVRQRRVFGIHAGWSAGKDQPSRLERGDIPGASVVAENAGINVALADATRDDLRVLGTEIENDNLIVHRKRRGSFCPSARNFAREKSGGLVVSCRNRFGKPPTLPEGSHS